VYGRKKRYIKIPFAVDVRTGEVIAMDVTKDDRHDYSLIGLSDTKGLLSYDD
jgi:hypothetical protein